MFPTDLLQQLPKIGNHERDSTDRLQSIGSLQLQALVFLQAPSLHQGCKGFQVLLS